MRFVRFLYIVPTCVITLTATLPGDLFAQTLPVRFRRLSVADGLSQQVVNAIAQDKQGFLWFGTQDGLNRFDGYSFIVFNSAADNSAGLPNNYISRLLCANDGKIWAGTIDGGVSVYDPKKEIFTTYQRIPGDSSSLRTNNAAALYQDRNGEMWVGLWNGGLSKMDTVGGKARFVHHLHDPHDPSSLSDNRVSSMIEDREGNLWVGTWNGLNRMARNGRFTRYFHSNSDPHSLGGNMVWSLTLDSTGCIWIGTWDGGVSRYNPTTHRFHVYQNKSLQSNSLSSNRIRCVYTDHDGIVWIATYDTGLDRYDPLNDAFIHYRNIPSDPSSLPDDEVQSLLQDAAGTFWIGTASGIANVNPYRHKFPLLKLPEDVPSASFNQLRAINVDRNGDIWYGTRGGGLVRVSHSSNKFIRYQHSPKDLYSLSHDFVSALYRQRNGAMWVGTQGGGLNRMGGETGRFHHFVHDPHNSTTLAANDIASVLETSDGSLWIGTDGHGLDQWNPETEKFSHFRDIAGDSTSLSGNYVWALLEDNRKNLWVGTWGAGLNKFDSKTQKFIRYRHIPGDSTTLAAGTVLCMTNDHQGRIWIGTTDGVSCFDYTTNHFRTYTDRHGLADHTIDAIAVDRHNLVWVATNRGISRFDEAIQSFRNYTMSDGLQGIEFAQGVSAADSRGRIYFGGNGGLNIFDPDSVKDNPYVPSVQITRMKVMEQPFPLANVSDKGIVLNYDQNFLSFEYAALSFAAPEQNQYIYILEGVDAGWVQAGTRRYASYPRLTPGTYVFRVRGSNNDGVWNLEGASLTITIIPPFWMTWWFRSFLIIGFLSIGPILYFRRVSQLEREKKRQEEFSQQLIDSQEEERKRIASELHDSIGQNLLYIKNSAVLGMKKKDLKRFPDIGETASSAIEEVRRIAFNLFPYQLDRLGLTKAVESVVRKIGESSGIECRCEIHSIDGLFSKEKESSIFRIVQECLNNIVKHSGAEKAAVLINITENGLSITIGDNGRGFNVEQTRNRSIGFGLKNIQNRVALLQGKLSYTESKEFKTLISITLPIKNEQEDKDIDRR